MEEPSVDRDRSWLAFNARVLQEAADLSVPLFERIQFMAIWSSNLEEFFRVRVAALRGLLRLRKKNVEQLSFSPSRRLRAIQREVARQQERFGQLLRGDVLPELERHGIVLLADAEPDEAHVRFLRDWFERELRPRLDPVLLDAEGPLPFLKDRHAYLVAELWPRGASALTEESPVYAMVEVPSPPLPRFVALPAGGDRRAIVFLDDVIRLNLPTLFPGWDVGAAFAVKLSRDADLHLEEAIGSSLVEAVRTSLSRRDKGPPCRFVYDVQAPYALVSFLRDRLGLEDEDLVAGGRYHNLHDLASLPRFGLDELAYPSWEPLPHPRLTDAPSILEVVGERDQLLHFPYQSFDPVVRFLTEAAADDRVDEIALTVYRVSADSPVLNALLEAAERGKRVRVFVEVQARFDEASNLAWAERMERAGIVTLYSLPGVKVHAKVALVTRREEGGRRRYAYLATGNFNERTARTYADHGLLTADPRLTTDVEMLFRHLAGEEPRPVFHHLLVAPFGLREGIYRYLADEEERVARGEPGQVLVKLNNLEDPDMGRHLYRAARRGVDIRMVIRGICCVVPGVAGWSEGIHVTSIVDRYLEHARIYAFRNGGDERVFLASADWMERNLSRRVEVAFPVYDPDLRAELGTILGLQLADNVKARVVDAGLTNRYVPDDDGSAVRAQERIRRTLQRLLVRDAAPPAVAASD